MKKSIEYKFKFFEVYAKRYNENNLFLICRKLGIFDEKICKYNATKEEAKEAAKEALIKRSKIINIILSNL